MLRNFVLETSTAPGTNATINLAGPATGRRGFLSEFPTGSLVYYFMDDGTQAEAGYGAVTAGAPNTLARTTVVWDSTNGSTSPSRRNFTGTVRVYNEVPADRVAYFNSAGYLGAGTLSPAFRLHVAETATDANLGIDAPNGRTRQVIFNTSGSVRWTVAANASSETGGNAGSNFAVNRFSDAGAFIDSPIVVTRSTGATSLLSLSVGGAVTVGSAGLTVNGGTSVQSLGVSTTLNVTGAVGFSSSLTVSGTLGVGGAVSFSSSAVVAGSFAAGSAGNFSPLSARVNGVGYNGASLQAYANSNGCPAQFGIENGVGSGDVLEFFWTTSLVGSISTNGAVIFVNGTSDGRLKTVLGPITGSGAIVDALRPVRYEWNNRPGEAFDGFIAQEIHTAYPGAVSVGVGAPGEAGFRPWQVDATKLLPIVLAELQDVRRRLAALEAIRVGAPV